MDPKKTVKIKRTKTRVTPERTFISDSILEERTKKVIIQKDESIYNPFSLENEIKFEKNLESGIFNKSESNSFSRRKERTLNFILTFGICILLFSIFCMYFITFKSFKRKTFLENEILKMKSKMLKYENIIKKIKDNFQNNNYIDYCRQEMGSYIFKEDTSMGYKYGFLSRNLSDPNNIFVFNENNCFAIAGEYGKICILFKNSVFINQIVFLYPFLANFESKIKEIQLIAMLKGKEKKYNEVLIGEFTFKSNRLNRFVFDFKKIKSDGVKIIIKKNFGCKKYTSLYKIIINNFLNVQ